MRDFVFIKFWIGEKDENGEKDGDSGDIKFLFLVYIVFELYNECYGYECIIWEIENKVVEKCRLLFMIFRVIFIELFCFVWR